MSSHLSSHLSSTFPLSHSYPSSSVPSESALRVHAQGVAFVNDRADLEIALAPISSCSTALRDWMTCIRPLTTKYGLTIGQHEHRAQLLGYMRVELPCMVGGPAVRGREVCRIPPSAFRSEHSNMVTSTCHGRSVSLGSEGDPFRKSAQLSSAQLIPTRV